MGVRFDFTSGEPDTDDPEQNTIDSYDRQRFRLATLFSARHFRCCGNANQLKRHAQTLNPAGQKLKPIVGQAEAKVSSKGKTWSHHGSETR
jgi:hypothetical protein